jgi:hypothetical protein
VSGKQQLKEISSTLHGTGGGHFTDDDIFGSKEEGLMKEKI